MIKNNIPTLLAEKFGGEGKINLSRVQEGTNLAYSTVSAWAKNRVERADFPAIEAWCKYLGVQPGDILSYEPDEVK